MICNMHVQHYSCLRSYDRSFICSLIVRLLACTHTELRHCSMNEHRLLICLPKHTISFVCWLYITLFMKNVYLFRCCEPHFSTAFRFFFTFLHSKWFVQSMHIVLQSDFVHHFVPHASKIIKYADWPTEWKREMYTRTLRFVSKMCCFNHTYAHSHAHTLAKCAVCVK